jgi:hypothetical protein
MREQRFQSEDGVSAIGHMSDQRSLSALELYQVVRSQIEHEDNLVSARLSWLLASQSFLFTAYAITLNGPLQSHFKTFETNAELLISMLTLVGIASALLIWASILAGIAAMKKLKSDFEHRTGNGLPNGLPPIQTMGTTLLAGQLGPVLIPLLFTTVWLMLLVRG